MMDISPEFYGVPSTPCIYNLKVKVTDSEFLCRSFTLKVLGPRYFQTQLCISFMFGMTIDTIPKFYRVPSPCSVHDLKVKVMDLEFLCETFTLKMLQKEKAQFRRAVLYGDRSYSKHYTFKKLCFLWL